MGILNTLLSDQHSQIINQLAQHNDINTNDVQNIIGQLLPALTNGIQQNISQENGINHLITALGKGNHQRYLDRPDILTEPSTISEGNAILSHVLGNKETSRHIAMQAAQATGIDNTIVKKLLPLIATVLMGSLSKEASNSPVGGIGNINLSAFLGENSSPVIGLVSSFLDSNNDGNVTDDLLNLAKKFF